MSIAQAACRPPCLAPAASRAAPAPSSCSSVPSSHRWPVRKTCSRAEWAPPPRRLLCRAAAEEAAPEAEEEEEEYREPTWDDIITYVKAEEFEQQGGASTDFLTVTRQIGLQAWQPEDGLQQRQHQQQAEQQQQAATAAGEAAAEPATFEELLAQLPGMQRMMRDAAQERTGLVKAPDIDPWTTNTPFRFERKQQPQLSEWDLRAKMEKRRRQDRERAAWDERRDQAGRFPSLGADWRTDVRLQETGDPTDPVYREWSHKEVWDLLTLNGRNADPRDVELFVRDPDEIVDAPAQGGDYRMEAEEYFESKGQLIREEELAAIAGAAGVGKDGDADGPEAVLLAAEFSDFDDELGDFDADYSAGAAGGDDDGF